MAKQKSEHYVDNKKFYIAMKEYVEAYNHAVANELPLPRPSNYIGKCIMLICERMSLLRNFINYSFREEMIYDGVENCLTYLHKFNPEKYQNPFAYFSQISYYAFIRRIQKEEKQQYIKQKSLINASVMNTLVQLSSEDNAHFQAIYVDLTSERSNNIIEKFESKLNEKKKKKQEEKDLLSLGIEDEQIELDTSDHPTDDRELDKQTK